MDPDNPQVFRSPSRASEPEQRGAPPARPRAVRPQQSSIRLQRIPSKRPNQNHDGNPPPPPQHEQQQQQHQQQQVRSMLDVDGGREQNQAPIHLRRLESSRPDHLNNGDRGGGIPQPGRSMLDVPEQPDDTQTIDFEPSQPADNNPYKQRLSRFRGRTLGSRRGKKGNGSINGDPQPSEQDMYDANIVDMLDVVDPEVATLSSITNIQNSLFIPSMGKWLNRRPTYNLSRIPPFPGAFPSSQEDVTTQPPGYTPHQQPGDYFRPGTPSTMGDLQETPQEEPPQRPTAERIPSAMTDRFFAVRPHDTSLADWSDEDLEELNDHVRHMLHSKRSKFKRRMKAFGQYVRRPLGFCVTLYATLITLFGLAWVLFLIGWIYVGEKQLYIINVIDLVLVALFAIVGDGMIPWRTVDTYHMIYIARYHHLTWKLRDRIKAPDLKDKNDLPHETVVTRQEELDLEAARNRHAKEELSVLTPEQQRKLEHHQTKFANSHTFYKPHETETHYAFPLRLLVAVVVLLDCHSCFQIALGLCTWCIDYRTRPGALTATILSCSIAVNTTAGILITIGDRRTRKKDVVERMFRQELTKEAMRRVQERKEKEAEKEAKKEAENNGLAKINEEDGKVRSSFDIGGLPKPTLDFLHSHKKSDDGSGKGIKRKPVPDQSRKSLDQVGRFSADTVYAPGWGSDAEASHQGTSSRPVVGAFPDEH